MPRFTDHYQLRIPRDLGHYTLDTPEILVRQAEMARNAGIEGFIFYFYWFNRKRLMDSPLDMLLANPQIDLPFCLMWANENWSRRWDGSEDDILIAQDYRLQDDEALIDCLARYIHDSRYIHVDGRPLVMIYRPGTIPDAPLPLDRWRRLFRKRHNLDPIFVMGQAFGDHDPRLFGMDGAIEFPPHKVVSGCRLLNESMRFLDDDFSGQIYDYGEIVEKALQEKSPPFPLIRTASPSWDNDARRQGKGLVMHGSTPVLYEHWLKGLVDQAQENLFFGDPIVCINAWNEWAEGAYLEPDQHFGSAYLNATGRACTGFESASRNNRILLVGHDAFPAGAQRLLLEIGRTFRRFFGVDVLFVLLEGGAMLEDYRATAPVEILPADARTTTERLSALAGEGYRTAILNSAASAPMAPLLQKNGIRQTFLIHELPNILRSRNLQAPLETACSLAENVIIPARSVASRLELDTHPALTLLPQGLYDRNITFSPKTYRSLRRQLALSADATIVLGGGYADMRKGFDLFVQFWRKLGRKIHCVWIGAIEESLKNALQAELIEAKNSGTFHLPGQVTNVGDWLAAADVFVLPSREDPYPSIVLEALASGLPCVAFENSGGIPHLLEHYAARPDMANRLVPFGDVRALADTVSDLCRWSKDRSARTRQTLAREMKKDFCFTSYAEKLFQLLLPDLPRISVVIPSHNYAEYLQARLASIFAQTFPVLEVIVLDDASRDNSVETAHQTAAEWNREIRLIRNTHPSGSVFRQWRKAMLAARGDWIWIAEVDDLCEPQFLEHLVKAISQKPDAIMGFTDSRSIDEKGATLSVSYRPYCAQTAGTLLEQDSYYKGKDFLRGCLSERNLILNASSVLFQRKKMKAAFTRCRKDLETLKIAGDWRLYLELLDSENDGIVYVSKSLNIHRRHTSSATHALNRREHVEEVMFMHDLLKSRLSLPPSHVSQQREYRQLLEKQFGLKAG
ncbi:hypothetical protein GMO_14700 [Gluconobacter morbifer G707]|uniref:Glycosyltransferase 2-like domain-containing protein n=2 Tax=Gluconobacter TaxID=441 RepID=G6XJ04_9PROT|nr:hypothetical protein GMO_14700 [Gluconobacter morbifer G707]